MKKRLLWFYYHILVLLAHHYLQRHQPKVIWINGSVGKTSCRMIIYQTLQHFFPHQRISTSPKNFNGELWLSLSVFEITHREPTLYCFFITFWISFFRCFFWGRRYDIVLLEYGIDTPGEMDFILKVAHPDIGVFTAIDAVHSEQFGSPAEIAHEEIKMALHTKELVFLNQDDTYAVQLLPRIQVDVLTYQTKGYESEADISFRDCDFIHWAAPHEIQSTFLLTLKGKEYQIKTNLTGKANYGYIGVALAIVETLAYQLEAESWKLKAESWKTKAESWKLKAESWKLKAESWKTKAESWKTKAKSWELKTGSSLELTYELQPGRFSVFAGKHDSILFDSTYNASPLSVRNTIDTVFTIREKLFPHSEIWVVLGDMRELGDLTEQEHRLLAGYLSQVADKLFLHGQYMREYLADELEKVGFDQEKLFIAKNLKGLNVMIEEELTTPSDSSSHLPLTGESRKFPLLIFKGSQNTIFLEESVKHFLLHKSDEQFLTRQSKFWEEKKRGV